MLKSCGCESKLFLSDDDAVAAFCKFNGRFYGGKQLQCEFSHVTDWERAMCGRLHVSLLLVKKKYHAFCWLRHFYILQ